MGKTFVCSLCRNGIIGGGLYIDEQSITYSTQKLTVSPLYRSLVLPMNEIRELSWSQMVVPVAAISMKDGECYKFIIYNKSGFEKVFIFLCCRLQATAILDYHRQSSLSTTFFLLSEVFSRSAVASHAACVLTFLLSVPPHQRQLAYNSTAYGRSQHILAAFSKVGHLLFFIVIA